MRRLRLLYLVFTLAYGFAAGPGGRSYIAIGRFEENPKSDGQMVAPDVSAKFVAARADAAAEDPARINRNLIAITSDNQGLTWKGESADRRVLTVVNTGYSGYDPLVGQATALSRDVWVVMVPELKGFCAAHAIPPAELNLRLEQLIGLNPDGGRTRLVEIWASPDDLFRPSPDPEITDHEAETYFRGQGRFLTVSEEHVRWINDLKAISYGENGMPWTRLGYTYDWGNPDTIVGLSEFVIRKGSTVEIASVTAPADYCKQDSAHLPALTASGVANLASGAGGAISPSELISIAGERLGPDTPIAPGGFHQELGGVRVLVGEEPAEVSYVSRSRLIARVPDSIRGKNTALLSVEYNGRKSALVELPVISASPGIFAVQGAAGASLAINADGTRNGDDHPAEPGSVVALWGTGLGVAPYAGAMYPQPQASLSLDVGGAKVDHAEIHFAGYVFPGVAQVNFRIPASTPLASWAEVRLTAGSETSRKGVLLRLK